MAFTISQWFMIPFTILQSLTLMAFTAAAYRSIRMRNVAQHREWMVRSYAVVLIFLEGRVLMAIPAIGRGGMDSVVLVNWACLVISLVIAEFILRWRDLFPPMPATQGQGWIGSRFFAEGLTQQHEAGSVRDTRKMTFGRSR